MSSCSWKRFSLDYDKAHEFSISEWRWPHGVFVGWRVLWALWHLGWLTRSVHYQLSNYDVDVGWKYLIYLTHWSYIMITIQSILALIVVLNNMSCKGKNRTVNVNYESNNSLLEKALWLFTGISFDAAIVVTLMFWAFVFEELKLALTVVTHSVTTLYVLLDIMVTARPIRLFHFIYGMLYALIYGLFTVVYFVSDGTSNEGETFIYAVLNWNKTGLAVGVMAAVVCVAFPAAHLATYGLYRLRVFLRKRCSCGERSKEKLDIAHDMP